MFDFLAYFSVAFFITSLVTPIVRRWANLLELVDHPSDRKVHVHVRARLGGTAIAFSFLTCLFLVALLHRTNSALLIPLQEGNAYEVIRTHPFGTRFFVAALIVFLLGAWDDWKGASPTVKFAWQIIAAFIVLWKQPKFCLLHGFGLTNEIYQYLDLALGIFWVVYVCNAFNLIDGLDGLAAGTAFFASLGLFSLAIVVKNAALALLILLLAGAVLGFLQFNRYPARIFMGDSGSLFIGFCLAVFSLRLCTTFTTYGLLFAAPVIAIGVPLADTTLAIFRRWVRYSKILKADEPKNIFCFKKLFSADKRHIHHRMLAVMGHHRRAVNYFYVINFLLFVVVTTLAVFHVALGTWGILAIYTGLMVALYALLLRLGYYEIIVLQRMPDDPPMRRATSTSSTSRLAPVE